MLVSKLKLLFCLATDAAGDIMLLGCLSDAGRIRQTTVQHLIPQNLMLGVKVHHSSLFGDVKISSKFAKMYK